MTLSTSSNTAVCQGNGLTTSFDFTFPVPLASELAVYFTNASGSVTLLSPSVYSTTGIGTENGGSVTYPLSGSPIPTGTSLTIQRIVPYLQLTSLVNQSGYYPNVVENALDYLTMQTQQLAEQVGLCISVPLAATVANLLLPTAAARASQLVGFDANGNAVMYPLTASVGAGNLTDYVFNAGVDFTPGTTTTLPLSQIPGSAANVFAWFDGGPQFGFTLGSGTIIFPAPIPNGISQVRVKVGTTLSTGVPASGTVTDSTVAAGSKLAIRSAMWFDPKDPAFGAAGTGLVDDTVAVQACINAANAVGGNVMPSPGNYLCGALTVNASKGGAICAVPGTVNFIPSAASTTLFTVSDATSNVPFVIAGIGFDNSSLLTGCVGISAIDYTGLSISGISTTQMDYLIQAQASASSPTGGSFNLSINDIRIYGKSSISVVGKGTQRCFNTTITNVRQYTTGGDTWVAPLITLTRAINTMIDNSITESMSGAAIGLHIVGQCEGVFVTNTDLVYTASGVVADLSNGDAVLPSWLYFTNVGVDQFTVSGFDFQSNYTRLSNVNVTGGNTRTNSGYGLLFRGNCIDYTCSGVQVQNSWNDGLAVLSGASQGEFFGCNFNNNGLSGSGSDVDVVATTPLDPTFRDCHIGTKNLNGSAVINGGSTSRYVNSQRTAVNSNGTSNQVLATYSLPAGTFVDGKTIRVSASGVFAANGNSKTLAVQVGGVNIGSMTGSFNGIAWVFEGEVLRVDSNNVWFVSKTFAGSACNTGSAIQTPFNSAGALVVQLVATTTAASDAQMHHFDVELIS